MTPHRIGPLLCTTFLVLAGAASADQTWTTAWTPDSAPAARNNTGQEQDHSYKTNCYPCKRWVPGADSGRGAMINDPTNAAPRKCPGDNTDYLCKVCDGQGDLMDKPDSTECNTGDGKPGKCCDGICVEVPPEGMDPCEWATGNEDFRKKHLRQFHPVLGPEGFIVCIFGETYPCVPPENIPQAWKNAGIDKCVQQHEQYHKDHSPIQCPPCGTGIGTYEDAETERVEECCAFYDTLLCLNNLLNEASDNHKTTIQKAIDDATDKMLTKLHCWGGLDDQGKQYEQVQMPCN